MDSNVDLEAIKADTVTVSKTAFNYVVDEVQKLVDETNVDIDAILPLVKFILDRSATVAILVKIGKFWDAEIIFRSLLEVLSKLLIITTQSDEEAVEKKLNEYWLHIGEIEQLRASLEAEKLVNGGNMNDVEKFRLLILSEDERLELEARNGKDKRKRLSNDWSFNDILLNLTKNKDIEPMMSFEVLHFFWKQSSHIAHGDKVAMNAIRVREDIIEGKDFRDATQHLKLLKAANDACFWAAVQLCSFTKNDDKANELKTYFLAYNRFMTAIHKAVAAESDRQGYM
ncbi:DUF5677 domain-containing protein [Hymenobacter armeniacus]|uniref:Uncharacterized protein n=1 Tax=Hymenobacter armeniacus TaxID=2771358 RepID=A0ABR8JLD6_9BACT|nr:DUF5677 domain-containing protein [Hymenobacter armeniacus]MBD2720810.1 hypothetical protein [Hymenobacter armeniacus]